MEEMMRIRAAIRAMRGISTLLILLAATTSMAAVQEGRVRTRTYGATERSEQVRRSTTDRPDRRARTKKAAAPGRTPRRAKGRAARRNRRPRSPGETPRMRARRNHRPAARRIASARGPTQHRRGSSRAGPHRPRRKAAHRRGGLSVEIDVAWPWPHRHRRAWKPRYRYRQIVRVRVEWGHRRRSTRIDVRTRFHHRVRRANAHRAEVDVYLDAITLYAGGRYVGAVDRIPHHLSRVRATLYRDGRARFDRELFLVGTPRVGFELIATRPYDRYVLGAYHRGDWIEAGALDFYTGEVVPLRRSRLFRPHDFNGFVPLSLLPEDLAWRCDVGRGAISALPYRVPHASLRHDDYYGGASSADGDYGRLHRREPLRRTDDDRFYLEAGARIELSREAQLERIQ